MAGWRIEEHAGIEQPAGVEGVLDRAQRRGKELRALLIVPAPVVAANGALRRLSVDEPSLEAIYAHYFQATPSGGVRDAA